MAYWCRTKESSARPDWQRLKATLGQVPKDLDFLDGIADIVRIYQKEEERKREGVIRRDVLSIIEAWDDYAANNGRLSVLAYHQKARTRPGGDVDLKAVEAEILERKKAWKLANKAGRRLGSAQTSQSIPQGPMTEPGPSRIQEQIPSPNANARRRSRAKTGQSGLISTNADAQHRLQSEDQASGGDQTGQSMLRVLTPSANNAQRRRQSQDPVKSTRTQGPHTSRRTATHDNGSSESKIEIVRSPSRTRLTTHHSQLQANYSSTGNSKTQEADQQEVEVAKDQLATTQQELEAVKGQLATTQQELEAVKGQLATTQQELEAAKDQLATTHQELGAAKDQLVTTHQKLEAAKGKVAKAHQDSQSLQFQLNEYSWSPTTQEQLMLANQAKDVAQAKASYEHEEVIKTQELLGASREETNKVRTELEAATQALQNAQEEVGTLKTQQLARKHTLDSSEDDTLEEHSQDALPGYSLIKRRKLQDAKCMEWDQLLTGICKFQPTGTTDTKQMLIQLLNCLGTSNAYYSFEDYLRRWKGVGWICLRDLARSGHSSAQKIMTETNCRSCTSGKKKCMQVKKEIDDVFLRAFM
jgi:hypothetical protein